VSHLAVATYIGELLLLLLLLLLLMFVILIVVVVADEEDDGCGHLSLVKPSGRAVKATHVKNGAGQGKSLI
jgi:hypothetical protein